MALNDTITALGNSIINLVDKKTPIATANTVGMVKPDGNTISIDANGVISSNGGMGGIPIGTIIPVNATSNYVPDGSIPCNGAEYSKSQFSDLWNNYLVAGLLNTCTYTEYASDISTYGQCAKFAVDTVNNKFRVPLIKDGAVIQQALTDDKLGKSYNAGLPNITGAFIGVVQNGTGAFSTGSNTTSYVGPANSNNLRQKHNTFDASLSNPIYGNSDTVQPNAVALRYFVVVANGQINQSMMDWSAWASSLQGKANTDLSNLSDVGKKVIDGQWVAKEQVLSTETAIGTYTIDLSSYLPNDNYNYEVFITGKIGRTAANSTPCTIHSDINSTSHYIAFVGSDTTNSTFAFSIPIKKYLYYQIGNDSKRPVANSLIIAVRYRRIGTNK